MGSEPRASSVSPYPASSSGKTGPLVLFAIITSSPCKAIGTPKSFHHQLGSDVVVELSRIVFRELDFEVVCWAHRTLCSEEQ